MKPFKYKNIKLIAVESSFGCSNCYFNNVGFCDARSDDSIMCTSNLREDRLCVIFVESKFKFGR